MEKSVLVLGAGMVGVSCALCLQERGWAVTLVDRREPGEETSFGNSGVFSRSSIFPVNGPGLLTALPGYLLNRHPAVRWRASLLAQPLWLLRFLRECRAESLTRRSAALDALIALSMDINRRRIADCGLSGHLRETGWLKLWRTPSAAVAEGEARALEQFGIRCQVLDKDGIAGLEPFAAPSFSTGLHILDSASVDDPSAIVKGYASRFAACGGAFVKGEVASLNRDRDRWVACVGPRSITAAAVVIALGPWSGDLLKRLGYGNPMFFERGYHVHCVAGSGGPNRAIYDVEGGYVASPMRAGVRITSGVELAHRDDSPTRDQIDAAQFLARRTFGLGDTIEADPWLGSRPTLPDSLPMIGPIPRSPGLFAAFGHQHVGFSTGAGTGEIIATLLDEQTPPIDIAAFSPSRYLRS